MDTPPSTPSILTTYTEGRLLFEAKGWGLAKAAEELSEKPELARFHISHTKLSMKTKPGTNHPIEPEVAAAIEAMKTWAGYERQTEIVTAGLLALHGDPSVDVGQAMADLRERQLAPKLVEALERRGGQRAPRLGRAFWTRVAIAGSGALVGCLAVLVAPLLPGRAAAAAQPGPPVIIIPGAAADGSPLWFEPGTLAALGDPGSGPKRPAEQQVPVKTLPGQKVAPCAAEWGEVALHGNCWIEVTMKPPCGRLFRSGEFCYRPVAAEPKKPAP